MALPTFLVLEMRSAFRNCARQHNPSNLKYFRCFSNASVRRKDPPQYNPSKRSNDIAHGPSKAFNEKEQTGLAKRDPKEKGVSTERRVPVPLRVIPKAQLSPQVMLTPRQRLHVEMMTRHPNIGSGKEKRIYRERIQIYHMGHLKENIMAIGKVSSILCACLVSFVIAPAHITAGTAPWIIALIWLGGFVPGIGVHYMTKTMVNRVFLDLPEKARQSPRAVMEYAKNLPPESEIDIRYLKPWGLEGSVKASTSDLVPTKGTFLQPSTFTWRSDSLKRTKSSRFVPASFFVQSTTAAGSKSVNTIPGIWESVYKQIAKDSDKPSLKWKSNLEPYET